MIGKADYTIKIINDGSNGKDGIGISSISFYYMTTSTQSTPPENSSNWIPESQGLPTMDDNQNRYLWRKEVIVYTDPQIPNKVNISLMSINGLNGENGVGIKKITPLYYTSESATAPNKPDDKTVIVDDATQYNKWNKQIASLNATYNHFYTCNEVLYDDASGTKEWTDVVEHNIYVELSNNVNELNKWKSDVQFSISEEGIKGIVSSSLNVGAINLIRNSETLEFADYYFDGSVVATQSENQTTVRGVANAYQTNNTVRVM